MCQKIGYHERLIPERRHFGFYDVLKLVGDNVSDIDQWTS